MRYLFQEQLAERLGQIGLQDFSEGQIGKLQIHKSGRTRLTLGDNTLNFFLGTSPGYLQVQFLERLRETD